MPIVCLVDVVPLDSDPFGLGFPYRDLMFARFLDSFMESLILAQDERWRRA